MFYPLGCDHATFFPRVNWELSDYQSGNVFQGGAGALSSMRRNYRFSFFDVDMMIQKLQLHLSIGWCKLPTYEILYVVCGLLLRGDQLCFQVQAIKPASSSITSFRLSSLQSLMHSPHFSKFSFSDWSIALSCRMVVGIGLSFSISFLIEH